jgi:hypothetical protein
MSLLIKAGSVAIFRLIDCICCAVPAFSFSRGVSAIPFFVTQAKNTAILVRALLRAWALRLFHSISV